jgi:hypothetical protein
MHLSVLQSRHFAENKFPLFLACIFIKIVIYYIRMKDQWRRYGNCSYTWELFISRLPSYCIADRSESFESAYEYKGVLQKCTYGKNGMYGGNVEITAICK